MKYVAALCALNKVTLNQLKKQSIHIKKSVKCNSCTFECNLRLSLPQPDSDTDSVTLI